MARARDSQRSKVWNALDTWTKENVDLQREMSLYECCNFVERCVAVLDADTIPVVPYRLRWVVFKDGRGRRHAGLGDDETEWVFPKRERTRWRVLMFVAWSILWDEDVAWHGQEFCTLYHSLVNRFLGRAAATRLVVAFKNHEVRYKPPRKPRALTAEQRVAQNERLARARLKKELKHELDDGMQWNLGERLETLLS